jgi:hypothetical protein
MDELGIGVGGIDRGITMTTPLGMDWTMYGQYD